jgi:hypothetical protein
MSTVQGKNVTVKFNLGNGATSIVCARSFSLEHTTQLLETTTLTTGKYRDYEGQSIDWTLTIGTVLDISATNVDAFDLLAAQIAFQKLPFEMIFIDDNGTNSSITGQAIVESTVITGATGDLVGGDITLRGCGKIPEVDTGGGTVEPNDTLLTRFYTALGGEEELSQPDYINADMIEVLRNGDSLLIVDFPTTDPNHVYFDASTGTLQFGAVLGEGEWIQTVYET